MPQMLLGRGFVSGEGKGGRRKSRRGGEGGAEGTRRLGKKLERLQG